MTPAQVGFCLPRFKGAFQRNADRENRLVIRGIKWKNHEYAENHMYTKPTFVPLLVLPDFW